MSGVIEDDNNKKLKDHVKEMESMVQELENHIKEADRADTQVVMSLQSDKIKYQGINRQLQEALKENQHLLSILHEKPDQNVSRTNSHGNLSTSCSTMSIVHLQYKYEELLANHNGLLKLLDIKTGELKKVYDENVRSKTEIEELKISLTQGDEKFAGLWAKFCRLKDKKNTKINKLKSQKETLQMVHNQLVNLLHKQCLEKDSMILEKIRHCSNSEKALLLQEVRKNNMLAYENFQLNQKLEFLRSVLHANKQQYNKAQSI